jgi:hypothetical protein
MVYFDFDWIRKKKTWEKLPNELIQALVHVKSHAWDEEHIREDKLVGWEL